MLGVIFMLIVLVLLALPFLPIKMPFTFFWFNFPKEKRPKNLIYIISTLIVILLVVLLMPHVMAFAQWFRKLEFVQWVLSLVPNHAHYGADIFEAVVANVLFCAVVLLVHWITGTLFGLFPKFSLKALKDAIVNAWKKAQEKRRQKKAKKNGQDPQQAADPQQLPAELYPEPEPNDFSSRIRLQGGQKTQPKQTAKTQPQATAQEAEDDSQFSLKKVLLKLFGFFYVKQEDVWYVQPQCKKVAKHLRNFVILVGLAYLVIFTLLMIPIFFKVEVYADTFYQTMSAMVENCYLYPAVSLVLLTELFWFMNGQLPEEPVEQISLNGSTQNSRIVDLDVIEQQLIKTYGSAYEVKSFYSGDVEGQERARIPVDISADTVLQTVVSFVDSQKLVRNDDYLRGIQALQQGKDTLFDAPLFTAVSMYLYPYLNIRISQGERLLVICQNKADIPGVIENLREGFRRVQHAHTCLWNITDRRQLQTNNETDVLVLTPEDFLDDRLFSEASDFFRRVRVALLPDADQVVMANNYLCVIIAERLKHAVKEKTYSRFVDQNEQDIQYIFLSTRHTLNLARSLTEYFMLEQEVYTAQAEYAYGNIRLYVWRGTGEGKILLDNSAQTVKLETSIAAIAKHYGIPNVSMFTDAAIFASQIDPAWLETYDAFDRPIGFTIVSDDSYNLPGTIYTYSRYLGKLASVLHVISKPYMLRDYFYDHAVRSLYERPLMERGMVEHAQMKKTGAVLLLCRLMRGIPVAEFAARMKALDGSCNAKELTFPVIRSLVDKCLTMAFGEGATADKYGFCLDDMMDQAFHRIPYIQIREEGLLQHLMADTQLVQVYITSSHETRVLPLFKRMLAQRYLPGQHMVIDHSNYKILSIDFDAGVITATSAKAVHNVPDQYVQLRQYTLEDGESFRQYCQSYAAGEDCVTPDRVESTQKNADGKGSLRSLTMVRSNGAMRIHSHTNAFYDSTNCPEHLNLADGSVFSVKTDIHRDVGNALYLRFAGDFSGDDKLTMTLAILLQEMMKTMFPDQYFCISVCPILENPDRIYNDSKDISGRIASMYPRLKGWGKPAEKAIELLIVDDCEGGTGVLDLLFEPEAVYFSNILDMLCAYLDWLEDHPEKSYLNFGAEKRPAIYQLERVRKILSIFAHSYQREHDLFQSMMQDENCCKFCGKPLLDEETFIWRNRHNICAECHNEMVPDEQQLNQIAQHICRMLDSRFGVKMPDVTVAVDPAMDVSGLNVGAQQILIEPELPLTAAHCEILVQIVRLWQLQNLNMTGEPEFDGQLLYVLIQYLEELEQYQHRKRLHNRALIGEDDRSVGYCHLRQALQAIASDNSFSYMLEHFTGKGKPPVYDPDPRKSTRTDPKKVPHYNQEQLSGDEAVAYENLLQGLYDMLDEIPAGVCLTQEQVSLVWGCVMSDHPELHWVNPYTYQYLSRGDMTFFKPTYWMDPQERDKRQSEIDEVIPQYLEGVTEETGDYEAALQIYMNMARQLDYDSLMLDREKKGELPDDRPDDLRNIYGALVRKRPVCAGYAFAYQYLLQQVGIEALKVSGDCHGGERHAWNIVKLEGKYYHTDVTWGDGSNTDPNRNIEEPNFGYFCLTDRDISLTRTADAEPEMPVCDSYSCNYFVRNGLFFTAYDHALVMEKLAKLLEEPARRRVDLRFEKKSVMEAAANQLYHNGGLEELLRATGRSGLDDHCVDNELNILTFFFAPLEQPKDTPKPEE